ncbi:hypothetical protein [Thermotomaculum hydrothermale]|uniref:hypothetical protein n=1 Tax=Thermotomaculum hydrothermale TaxID=981385 RepID=UPI0019166549|nr:hypothetical protein [Thermotomaculum hydrothermale]
MIKIILTNLIPDRNEQEKHDLKILEWICKENDNCVTVLELSKILVAENKVKPERIMESLLNYLKKNRENIVLIDTSRDHYWRDTFEDSIEGLKIIHNPYPDTLFQ